MAKSKPSLPWLPPGTRSTWTTASEYRFKVIANWRVGCIERYEADKREYIGRHHRNPRD